MTTEGTPKLCELVFFLPKLHRLSTDKTRFIFINGNAAREYKHRAPSPPCGIEWLEVYHDGDWDPKKDSRYMVFDKLLEYAMDLQLGLKYELMVVKEKRVYRPYAAPLVFGSKEKAIEWTSIQKLPDDCEWEIADYTETSSLDIEQVPMFSPE